MRRVLYLWLPQWPIDRRRMTSSKGAGGPAENAAFATVGELGGRRLLAAVNRSAAEAGLAPGMPLAGALAFVPGLETAAAQPQEDAKALCRLAEWCGRYSPWTAPDGPDGVLIEIAGSAHLWGGDKALAEDLAARLGRRGLASRIAVADTLGAAFAAAHFAAAPGMPAILPSGGERALLAALPVEGLRLDPAAAAALRRLGLRRIGDLYPMPRAALARRFGEGLAHRLDRALGEAPEPLSPLGEAPTRRLRLSFAEPIADPADLARATRRLARDLAHWLARDGVGARRLDLAFHRVDGRVERLAVATARPSRDPQHLARLFEERLEAVDPGLGVEDMILAAFAVEPLAPAQMNLNPLPPGEGRKDRVRGAAAACPPSPPSPRPSPPNGGRGGFSAGGGDVAGLPALLDRLGNRLGFSALYRLEPRESHIPERASVRVPVDRSGAARSGELPDKPPRPIRLFDPPQPVEASFLLPDDPPFHFTWRRRRHRVTYAEGPERIAAEWWRDPTEGESRDYYRVEDADGRRFWLFRTGRCDGGERPRWFLHGLFA
ncbi:MAG TPA: DNA polymerase Y family protein [Stellaceae bacterium]|nr:DNA polymerase Y family protein [Stellaceae bacterium]